MIGATSGLISGYIPLEPARAIYGSARRRDRRRVRAARAGGRRRGRLSARGRWAFGSGSEHCSWLLGGCVVMDDGKPRLLGRGIPDSRMMLFPASDVRIVDTWTVSGLRGTGSHDLEVADVFVPAERAGIAHHRSPVAEGPLFRFPVFGCSRSASPAVATGIARTAIDELVALRGRQDADRQQGGCSASAA
jgi:alkylation response protein AidB-like acyl-CoA dehydrogenase